MPLSPEEIANLIHATDNAVAELRLFTAATALFCMDYMRTFTREVEHVWKRELSTSAALFYLVRYPGLISTLFVVLEETGWAGISDKSCSIMVHVAWILNVVMLSAASVFSALRACALCWKDKRVFVFVLLLAGTHPALHAYAYAKLDISYTTSPAPGCGVTPDMSDAMYENWIIGARLSAVLTDMVVLGITIWKARTTRVQGVKISVKSTMVYILMRDGVLYFGVLLIANLIGLILARFLVLIQPINTWIAILTAVMTSRFILDLHEAADPRFDGDGDTSTLIFAASPKHTSRFDSDPSLGTSKLGADWDDHSLEDERSARVLVAECDSAPPEWEPRGSQSCLEAGTDARCIAVRRCGDVDSVIWIR